MIAWLWAKASKWLAIAGALIAAIGAALAFGFLKGEKTGAAKGDAEAAKAKADAAEREAALAASDQQAQQAAIDAASEVHDAIQKLPDAPAQQVGTADPSTAAGELRDDGWVRGDSAAPDGH